jgi:RNA polymerase sigma factor (sigma-70 family)
MSVTPFAADAARAVDAVWRLESTKIIAGLTRMVHDVGLAEELAQEALLAALEQWPGAGIPDSPGAWLMAVAKRRAVDHVRRLARQDRRRHELSRALDLSLDEQEQEPDDVLRLVFLSCHPALPTEERTALTLRLVGGLTTEEIARAFLVTEQVVAQRIAGAKRTLADLGVPFDLPDSTERLSSVLEVIYLIFNEGYSATSGDDLTRPALTLEALRLGRLVAELAPREPEVHGLVALMEIQASRTAARTGPSGEPVPLHEQNRGRWDPLLIRRGFTAMLRARALGAAPGPYVLQAAIAVTHAHAGTAEETDWAQIASLYDALAALLPTPVVHLNRAVAVGMARGPLAGLTLVDALLADPKLKDYHLLPGVRGDLLARLGRHPEARLEFTRAAALARNAAERAFLLRRADSLPGTSSPTLGTAARDFLARPDLDGQTTRSYGQTLRRLRLSLGDELPLDSLTPARVAQVFATAWSTAAPRTWNRHRAAIRSFGAWASLADLSADLERRAAPPTTPGPLDLTLPDAPLRERTLWQLLRESGAKVRAALALNVQDLDLNDRRAPTPDGWVTWRSGTAALLPLLLADRTEGPVFLADRRPGPARTPAPADLCPSTGRGRLSYERAEYLFKQATKPLDPAGDGYTLSRLKPRP